MFHVVVIENARPVGVDVDERDNVIAVVATDSTTTASAAGSFQKGRVSVSGLGVANAFQVERFTQGRRASTIAILLDSFGRRILAYPAE
jgi:hypothetical protein